MDKKKIEPTDAMVEAALFQRPLTLGMIRAILRDVLNHPDAPGLFADADDRPWEPLNEGTLLCRGDEVRRELGCITTTAAVARVDEVDALWTAEGMFIGRLDTGTWYVRRPAPELPPEREGVVLVPADGHESITTTEGQEFARLTFTTKQSIWYGPNLAARLGDWVIQTTSPSRLIPGTWKVDDQ